MIAQHQKAILQFSGGKDSTALLHMARPWLDKISVYFVDTGATFPHVMEFITETCDRLGARLTFIKPEITINEYIEKAGLPADIVPVESDAQFMGYLNDVPAVRLQPYSRCCSAMIWQPMDRAVKMSGATLVLRGSKAFDGRRGVPSGHIEGGIEYASPLWDWSDSDVMGYLKAEGIMLPYHYNRVNESLDCTICTAHLAHNGTDKMRFLRSDYPEIAADVKGRLGLIRDEVARQVDRVLPAFDAIGEA